MRAGLSPISEVASLSKAGMRPRPASVICCRGPKPIRLPPRPCDSVFCSELCHVLLLAHATAAARLHTPLRQSSNSCPVLKINAHVTQTHLKTWHCDAMKADELPLSTSHWALYRLHCEAVLANGVVSPARGCTGVCMPGPLGVGGINAVRRACCCCCLRGVGGT